MDNVKWYVCYKCNEVDSYAINPNNQETTFPRGEWLVHNEHIVTGINSKIEAEKLLHDDPYKMRKEKR